MPATWLLYGANGYTGGLIAEEAKRRGMTPTLAGRSEDAVSAIARRLELPYKVFALEEPGVISRHLDGLSLVLHCAGPFSKTSEPMVSACLSSGAHYLDITGEVAVFERIFARDAEALAKGVTLLPGVGFDVVPTDCLAAMLASRLDGATQLELAFAGAAGMSAGTTKTALESIGKGATARRDGRLVTLPQASVTKEIRFSSGKRHCVAIGWGDVSSAYRSTGIPNITVYTSLPKKYTLLTRLIEPLAPVLHLPVVEKKLVSLIERHVKGPDEATRASARMHLWGRVEKEGRFEEATLDVPEGYAFTVKSALSSVSRVLGGKVAPGAQTPSKAFGADFVLSLPKVERRWRT